jgi:hypothetical protein
MPREGQTTVTLPTYTWERAVKYYEKRKKQLKKKGIHSTSKLIGFWIEEKCVQKQSGKQHSSVVPSDKADAVYPHERKKQ